MSQVDYIESNFIILCHVRDIEMANIKSAVYVCIIKTHFLNLISHSKERERECWNLFFSIIHTFSACTFEILISASCLDLFTLFCVKQIFFLSLCGRKSICSKIINIYYFYLFIFSIIVELQTDMQY